MTTETHDLIARTHRNIAAAFCGSIVEVTFTIGEHEHLGLNVIGRVDAVVGYSLIIDRDPAGDGDVWSIPLADVAVIAKVS